MGFYREILDAIQEKALSSKDRNKLEDSDYGVPELRKYPLTDKRHVSLAITYFDKCEKKYQPTLAKNIIRKIKEYDMHPKVSPDNGFYKYYKKYMNESADSEEFNKIILEIIKE